MNLFVLWGSLLVAPMLLIALSCRDKDDGVPPISTLQQAYQHGTPPGDAPWSYYLTTFGEGSDTQPVACGGKYADGTWYYSTGAYTFGCNKKLKLEANGKCVVVEVVDNGPAAWVETKAANQCGGLGYIIDASPLVSKDLFNASGAGWSDCLAIMVSLVDDATPTGPCTTTNPSCGNGSIESGETCDPPSSCPTSCEDNNPCTTDVLSGSASQCNAACANNPITTCTNNDGCCPANCIATSDNDCSVQCGNGSIETGETCDPPSSCPTSCDDNNACTNDVLSGNASQCNASCKHTPITACIDGDQCCPSSCTNSSDSDCSSLCGNNIIEEGETCDPASSCPTTCDDANACTTDLMTGSPYNCNVACTNSPITTCIPGDGCCPPGCDNSKDSDCSSTCGNNVIDVNETCDPPSTCISSCNDNAVCTSDVLEGSPANCNSTCRYYPITACMSGDGCCPQGCNGLNDTDCGTSDPGPGPNDLNKEGGGLLQGGCGIVHGAGRTHLWLFGVALLLGVLYVRRRRAQRSGARPCPISKRTGRPATGRHGHEIGSPASEV